MARRVIMPANYAMEILVTGGTGFVGRHLARALLLRGHRVRLAGRDFSGVADLLAAGATRYAFDLADRAATRVACDGADAVMHVGALSAAWGPRAAFAAANIAGTESVIEACRAARVARLVHVSSPSVVFAGRDVVNITERAPYPARFSSDYAWSKKVAEERVAASGLPFVIIRPKAIFGPGDRALLPRLLAVARRGRLPQIGDGRNRVDLTYVDNVVHSLLCALENDTALGKTFHITNDEHPRLWDVIRALLADLHLPAPRMALPLPVALAAAAGMEAAARLTGREPLLTRYAVEILACTQTYDISAARRDLGYAPVVPLADGIARTLAALHAETRS